MSLEVAFRLPLRGHPRAVFESDYGLRGGRLLIDRAVVLEAPSRQALATGVSALVPGTGERLSLCVAGDAQVRVFVGDVEAAREDRLRVPPTRSAWLHAWLALSGSVFGLAASWMYVRRASLVGDPWAMKMAMHMAVWHLVLTLTLFPASVWGQRLGIRACQVTSLLFFLIHVGIAFANVEGVADGPWVAILNAASGVAFLAAVLYGQRAHRDMNPLRALDDWQPQSHEAAAPIHASAAAGLAPCRPESSVEA